MEVFFQGGPMPGKRNLVDSVFPPATQVVKIVLNNGTKGRYVRAGETLGIPLFEWELEEEASG